MSKQTWRGNRVDVRKILMTPKTVEVWLHFFYDEYLADIGL
jgi:hypothetical protein